MIFKLIEVCKELSVVYQAEFTVQRRSSSCCCCTTTATTGTTTRATLFLP